MTIWFGKIFLRPKTLTATLTTAYKRTTKLITFQSTPWPHHLLASVPYFYAILKGNISLRFRTHHNSLSRLRLGSVRRNTLREISLQMFEMTFV